MFTGNQYNYYGSAAVSPMGKGGAQGPQPGEEGWPSADPPGR